MGPFRRKDKREYDGPANNTTAIEVESGAAIQAMAIIQKSSSRGTSRQSSMPVKLSSDDNNHRDRDRSSSSSSNNNKLLASGISSRRSSQKVRNHLPAHMMTASPLEEKRKQHRHSSSNNNSNSNNNNKNRDSISIPTQVLSSPERDDVSIMSGTNSVQAYNTNSSNKNIPNLPLHQKKQNNNINNNRKQQQHSKPQLPMEHDGGILCLCAVPTTATSSSSQQQGHRFLSGGADGTIKLWEVATPAIDKSNKLTPKLLKTYTGHHGYVHSISILGLAYDPLPTPTPTTSSSGVPTTTTTTTTGGGGSGSRIRTSASLPAARGGGGGSVWGRSSSYSNNNDDQSSIGQNSSASTGDKQSSSPLSSPITTQHCPSVSRLANLPGMKAMKKRRSSLHSMGSVNSNSASALQNHQPPRKRLFFVSASRDNTLRIWPIIDNIHHHSTSSSQHFNESSSSDYNNNNNHHNHNNTLDDSSTSLGERSTDSKNNREDPLAKGIKLRGHQFGKNNTGGVLCVCAVPSLAPDDNHSYNNGNGNNDGHQNRSNSSLNSIGSYSDINNNNTNILPSAGQFASGGCDGCVRIWDVQSALNTHNIKRIPKSVTEMKGKKLHELQCEGMYASVQLQCIKPPGAPGSNHKQGSSGADKNRFPAAITSVVCTHQAGMISSNTTQDVSLFAGDASGTIRRYSRQNECGGGHTNGAIWWGCTGIFVGHTDRITSMSMLISNELLPLLCPNIDYFNDDEKGTMLISSCDDGWVRVWDAFDARDNQNRQPPSDMYDENDAGGDYVLTDIGRIPKRTAMWEIELNSDQGGGGGPTDDSTISSSSRTHKHPSSVTVKNHMARGGRIGVTSLTTLQSTTLMAAGTTDGAIRMWNVSSGLYEGAYNLGKSVQIWSLDIISEQTDDDDDDDDTSKEEDSRYDDRDVEKKSVGIIVSGDNRGRIRVLRKVSTITR